MTPKELETRQYEIIERLTQIFRAQRKLHMQFILVLPDGSEIFGIPHIDADADKDALMAHLRNYIVRTGAQMVCIAAEAWSIAAPEPKMTPEELTEYAYRYGKLADHPMREEILSITFETADSWAGFTMPIKRDSEDTPHLGDLVKSTNYNGGRLGNLFGTRPDPEDN